MIETIRLTPDDAERYVAIRRVMLFDTPWAFGADPDNDRGSDVDNIRSSLPMDGYEIVAVERDNTLVATAGIMRPPNPKFHHRAKVWGVFAEKSERGKGYGRAVLNAVIEIAKSWEGVRYVDLGVSAEAPEAFGLYQSLGFIEWGREPGSSLLNGREIDEVFLCLELES